MKQIMKMVKNYFQKVVDYINTKVNVIKGLPIKTKNLMRLGVVFSLAIALPVVIWAVNNLNFNPYNKAASGEPLPTEIATSTPAIANCNATCGTNYACQGGLVCFNGTCRNPSCVDSARCFCPTPTPMPTAVPTSSSAPTPTPSPYITVTSPNGGETLTFGQQYSIQWSSSHTFTDVTLYYSISSGFSGPIVSHIPDTGSFVWLVNPVYGAGQYKIYINGDVNGYNYANDSSDNFFSIVPAPTPAPLTPTPSATPTPMATAVATPSPSSSPVSCNIADINKDGIVNDTDRTMIINYFLNPYFPKGDLNSDGVVDLTDYSIVVKNYMLSTGPCQ